MKRRPTTVACTLLSWTLVATAAPAIALAQEEATTLQALSGRTHFHGIAVAPDDSATVYLATHHGLYRIDSSGAAQRLSERSDDFMGFSVHPVEPDLLYASGHPGGGGNLGIIVSRDGGRTWRTLAQGVNGPVDFHQMTISPADPQVLYGVHGGLQRSRDGGRTWEIAGPAPPELIDLAGSTLDADTLYAATRAGLLRSRDGGGRWQAVHPSTQPVAMVEVTGEGMVYAYILGAGLVRAGESDLEWRTVSADVDGGYVLHLAVGDEGELYAITYEPQSRRQSVRVSRDGGATWGALGGRASQGGS